MMTDDRRRKVRRIVMIAVAPLALAAVLLSLKLISVNAFAAAEQTAYQRRAWAEAEQQATGLGAPGFPGPWYFPEAWKGPYNIGVAQGMGGRLPEARANLEQALEMQGEPGSNEYCVVLTSLVYVVEKQGDEAREADDTQAANAFYQEALTLITEAPEGCMEPPEPGEANTQQQLETSVPRIEEKIESEGDGGDEEQDGGEGEQEPEEDPNAPPTQQEQLEEQNQDAQEQQQQQEEYAQQQEQGGGGSDVERPW